MSELKLYPILSSNSIDLLYSKCENLMQSDAEGWIIGNYFKQELDEFNQALE